MWAPTGELYHHGILGQKWGHKNGPPYPLNSSDHSALEKKMAKSLKTAERKTARIRRRDARLEKKAAKYDERSATYHYRSEKNHAKYDLGKSKSAVRRAARLAMKSAKIRNKSLKTASEERRLKLQNKADKVQYKADLYNVKADTLAKSAKYNDQALKLARKSNIYKAKADKARSKMSQDKRLQAWIEKSLEKNPNIKAMSNSKQAIEYMDAKNQYTYSNLRNRKAAKKRLDEAREAWINEGARRFDERVKKERKEENK